MSRTDLLARALCFAVVFAGSACGGSKGDAQVPKNGDVGDVGGPKAPPEDLALADEIDCGDFHCCLRAGTSVRCWGHGEHGQLGTRAVLEVKPAIVPGTDGAVELALGGHFSCARMGDGSVKCWGSGRIVGDGKEVKRVAATRVEGIADAVQIEADGLLACARLQSGGVRCWGLDVDLPVPKLDGAVDIKVAEAHACAALKDGTVKCWGSDGGWGGKGKNRFQNPPLRDVEQIICVDSAACALVKGGKVKCWGRNLQGEMGVAADAESYAEPVEVKAAQGATQLMSGLAKVCALMPNKQALCWGNNSNGELGRGRASDWEGPGLVTGLPKPIVEIAFGADHACARVEGNQLYCWGNGTLGQLGDGTKGGDRLTPARVTW